MFNPSWYDNSNPYGIAIPGILTIVPESRMCIPLHKTYLAASQQRKSREFPKGALLEWYGGEKPQNVYRKPSREPFRGSSGVHILPPFGKTDSGGGEILLYEGKPVFSQGVAILFSSQERGMHYHVPRNFRIQKITVQIPEPLLAPGRLFLALFIGDLINPVFQVSLDGTEGERITYFLNSERKFGSKMSLVLSDLSCTYRQGPNITVSISGEQIL